MSIWVMFLYALLFRQLFNFIGYLNERSAGLHKRKWWDDIKPQRNP